MKKHRKVPTKMPEPKCFKKNHMQKGTEPFSKMLEAKKTNTPIDKKTLCFKKA